MRQTTSMTFTEELAGVAEEGARAGEQWLREGLPEMLSGSAAFIASGATFPVAMLWARLHEESGQPAWALSSHELEHRRLGREVEHVLISLSGEHFDTVNAARTLVSRGARGRAFSGTRDSAMAATFARAGLPVHRLPPPPAGVALASPCRIVGLAAAAARVHGGGGLDSLIRARASSRGELSPQARHVFCLGAGLAAPAARDLCEKLLESGCAMATCRDIRSFAHGAAMALARAPESAQVVGFALGSERAYFESFFDQLPASLPRLLIADPDEGPDAAVRLIIEETRVFEEMATARGLSRDRSVIPAWIHALYVLGR